ncbi:MAG: hypothetical protein A3J30_03595 [Candidatus Wildermuthbacteria bacterium RIFCSPLOWO2_02_FULL_47_9c]|uniref:Bis(5'-nucleosyl)-tetraphosphatase [asymmetrical] n=2 Tax=Parcubacteria group TaxID=1794811 RepID=A0A837IR25_9BACT|nr:MAG: NUDIX hydrolase [Candidatus Yanofskybacteria bacterium GW2011_GWC1_48_11]KKW03976.1 MAG: NUDIX hydrolase [Parcubacteria group bacterium GW2011_GWB1_49_12]KKW08678.1 MAG: NUDIX hydrolase [Parcubacteria group bacterium GW2011_GWA1_49_26]KKW13895.1 MAG: NUDIX hydrolase [Parcubacteria group bacterium GW2011_GWA2_50_10]OHA61628.1 MAG: hypothetical protein A2109_02690 [Candidatus Wildermuthbacteria bacterium GWA1_49_26]OHA65346.1 MAG: hypothetical protein A2674_00855 [Candidatus Wildermuthba
MKKERSAGAVICRIEKGEPLYLLLHYPSSAKAKEEYWDLPKGHVEEGELEEETVRREVAEETGLSDLGIFEGFRETISYWFQFGRERISKEVVFYLAQTDQEKVTISSEHLGFQWLDYAKAQEKLTYENARRVLKKAHHFIRAKGV